MIRKFIAGIAIVSLASCSFTDPVKYNDSVVNQLDSVTVQHDKFIDALGTGGDTMQVELAKMNARIEKSIANLNAIPKFDDGEEFKSGTVGILNQLQNITNNEGKKLTSLYQEYQTSDSETVVDDIEKTATEFDNKWSKAENDFETVQQNYVKKTGIKLQKKLVNIK